MAHLGPLPVPDSESAPFWEACKQRRLIIQCCAKCQTLRSPPARFCPVCQSSESQWQDASGSGVVFSWIVVRHPVPKQIYESAVPYVVALISLDEGVRLVSNIVDCSPEAVTAGMRVKVSFVDVTESVTLPVFHPQQSDIEPDQLNSGQAA